MAKSRRDNQNWRLKDISANKEISLEEYRRLLYKIRPFGFLKEAKWARKQTNRIARRKTKAALQRHDANDDTVYPKQPRTSGWVTW